MIGCFKSLREAIRTGAANFVESQSELMKASEKPSCTVRTQRSDQDSSRPLLARGKTAISRFYRASVPVGRLPLPPPAPATGAPQRNGAAATTRPTRLFPRRLDATHPHGVHARPHPDHGTSRSAAGLHAQGGGRAPDAGARRPPTTTRRRLPRPRRG